MLLRFISSLVLIASVIAIASAQRGTVDGSPLIIENPVEAISLSHNAETATITLNLRGIQPDGCEFPIETEAEITENRIDVRFVRVIPEEEQDSSRCTRNLVVVDGTTDVVYDPAILGTYESLIIAVNEQPLVEAKISLLPTAAEDATAIYFDALIPFERFDVLITRVELRPALDGSPYGSVIVNGEQTGCDASIEETQAMRDTTLFIEVYQSVDSAAECTQTFMPFEITIPIRQPVSGAMTVNVNDIQVEHGFRILQTTDAEGNPLDVSPIARPTAMPFNVEAIPLNFNELLISIDNNGDLPRLFVTVRGEHPDGCDFPLNADVQQEQDTITVQLTREVNRDLMCPMILAPYEHTFDLGEFETGNYQLNINGVSVEVSL